MSTAQAEALRIGQFKARDEFTEGIDGNHIDQQCQEFVAVSRFNHT